MQPKGPGEIPAETVRVARSAFHFAALRPADQTIGGAKEKTPD